MRTQQNSKTLALDPNGPEGALFWRSRAQDLRFVLDRLDGIEAAMPGLAGVSTSAASRPSGIRWVDKPSPCSPGHGRPIREAQRITWVYLRTALYP